MEVFSIDNLTYHYPNRETPALSSLSLKIFEGEFIVVAGASGSGKSTLARVITRLAPEFYGGIIEGEVEGTMDIGMVFQDPEKQLVMETVEREVAFPLENRGIERNTMRKQVLEVLTLLGIWHLKDKKTYELSGGEKQKVAIAAALAVRNRFLVLDEPVSQLDPMAADEIMHLLKKLNDDLGFTIVLVEQRTEKCLSYADRVVFLEEGKLDFDGKPDEYVKWIRKHDCSFMPPVTELFARLESDELPLTVKEGRKLLSSNYEVDGDVNEMAVDPIEEKIMEFRNVDFSFENGTRALSSVNLDVGKGETLGIIGANGAGKSTALRLMAGLLKPGKGSVAMTGNVGYLSQEPNDYLFNDTVYEELLFTQKNFRKEAHGFIEKILNDLNIESHRDVNPRDLSGGERQRVALASVLAVDPGILLLDEPTRGLNRGYKGRLATYLRSLQKKGKTIILVTHDMEFVADVCDRVVIMFDGEIAQDGPTREILSGGLHFTTDINRLFHGMANPLILEEAADICTKRGHIES
ncbi:MAG: ABC transporter ATP-binding protein [Peptostreptococcaceae bacterium]|nr:ABC transporter ATP-binding protein [Peptostreptococcaceae bacterium]